MSQGMDAQYLKDLQQVLEAEAALAREGTDLLADPEYKALRELFIDGDLSMAEFLGRVEALASARPDENEQVAAEAGDGAEDDDAQGDPDDLDDLDDFDDLEKPGGPLRS